MFLLQIPFPMLHMQLCLKLIGTIPMLNIWESNQHFRYAQTNAYIIGRRSLVKSIIKGCIKCRILHKKGVEVAMGSIGKEKLKMAPPFYFSQIDLCGPFSAFFSCQ